MSQALALFFFFPKLLDIPKLEQGGLWATGLPNPGLVISSSANTFSCQGYAGREGDQPRWISYLKMEWHVRRQYEDDEMILTLFLLQEAVASLGWEMNHCSLQ